MRIAIIGSGVSGSVAARLLSTRHDVTLFEANNYLGGHANTVNVELFGQQFQADTGFMVFNRRTYPNFCRLLELLGIESQPTDMSFSVRCLLSGLEYQGSSLNGLFAQRSNLLNIRFFRMLTDIIRFNREGMRATETESLIEGETVGDFLRRHRLSKRFTEHYLVPMSAAIWSADPRSILDFPAKFMLGFFANHGLMQLRDRPQWLTIPGGSRRYIAALLAPLADRIRLNTPIESVRRYKDTVSITTANGEAEEFDHVVFATHADQTRRLLGDASPAEDDILSCFPYQSSSAMLHTDLRLLPTRSRAWASWNYTIGHTNELPSVTYDLSRLQNLATSTPLLLTLNADSHIDPSHVIRRFNYAHPSYSLASIEAQRRHAEISGYNRTHYCGAYWGFGFHEDGVNSALSVTRQFGIGLDHCRVASTKASSRIVAINR